MKIKKTEVTFIKLDVPLLINCCIFLQDFGGMNESLLAHWFSLPINERKNEHGSILR